MTFKAHLEKKVREIFQAPWTERERRVVPSSKDLSLGNDADKIIAAVLYADMADSTDLVDHHNYPFAAAIYKAFLFSAIEIITTEQGSITAYDGDRVMAIFTGEKKETLAVRSALKINYAVSEIINPLMKQQYRNKKYQLKHVVGIDTSELFAARIGFRKDSDLIWVGRAANYAAKLCSFNDNHSTYITKAVYRSMDKRMKDGAQQWDKENWRERHNMNIYGSSASLLV